MLTEVILYRLFPTFSRVLCVHSQRKLEATPEAQKKHVTLLEEVIEVFRICYLN